MPIISTVSIKPQLYNFFTLSCIDWENLLWSLVVKNNEKKMKKSILFSCLSLSLLTITTFTNQALAMQGETSQKSPTNSQNGSKRNSATIVNDQDAQQQLTHSQQLAQSQGQSETQNHSQSQPEKVTYTPGENNDKYGCGKRVTKKLVGAGKAALKGTKWAVFAIGSGAKKLVTMLPRKTNTDQPNHAQKNTKLRKAIKWGGLVAVLAWVALKSKTAIENISSVKFQICFNDPMPTPVNNTANSYKPFNESDFSNTSNGNIWDKTQDLLYKAKDITLETGSKIINKAKTTVEAYVPYLQNNNKKQKISSDNINCLSFEYPNNGTKLVKKIRKQPN